MQNTFGSSLSLQIDVGFSGVAGTVGEGRDVGTGWRGRSSALSIVNADIEIALRSLGAAGCRVENDELGAISGPPKLP